MKVEQRIVVGTSVFGNLLTCDRIVEHTANGNAINVGGFDAKANNAAREKVLHHHDPAALEPNGFAADLKLRSDLLGSLRHRRKRKPTAKRQRLLGYDRICCDIAFECTKSLHLVLSLAVVSSKKHNPTKAKNAD
jgi:hypothetical protein